MSPLVVIGPVMVEAAKRTKVPVCVHLDHCETLDYMEKALEIGFTGVMYDGSALPYEENLANTKIAVAIAKKYNCGVEAELGALASREGGESAGAGPVYTDPDQAVVFCRETVIDALKSKNGNETIIGETPMNKLYDRAEIYVLKISQLVPQLLNHPVTEQITSLSRFRPEAALPPLAG